MAVDKLAQIRALRAKAQSTSFPAEAAECNRLADALERKHGAEPRAGGTRVPRPDAVDRAAAQDPPTGPGMFDEHNEWFIHMDDRVADRLATMGFMFPGGPTSATATTANSNNMWARWTTS